MEMKLNLLKGRTASGLVSFGTMWKRGEMQECVFTLRNESGTSVPVQSVPAAYWPDCSLKWVRHTAQANEMGAEICVFGGKEPVRPKKSVSIEPFGQGYHVHTACLDFDIPGTGSQALLTDIRLNGKASARELRPVFLLSRCMERGDAACEQVIPGVPRVETVEIEDMGDVAASFCFSGVYCAEEELMKYEIRVRVGGDLPLLQITNTMFFHGDPQRDRMKGLGIRIRLPMDGEAYNHHVRFLADGVDFHEPAQLLESRFPRSGPALKRLQLAGQSVRYPDGSEDAAMISEMQRALPVWNRFTMAQTGQSTCTIRKRTKEGCCTLDAYHAERGDGVMAVSSDRTGAMVGIRDFRERYPSALRVDDLGGPEAALTAWFWSPEGTAMDFSHYDDRSYPANYEGFEYFGADPEGIAATSEAAVLLTDGYSDAETVKRFAAMVQKPPVYTASPETYHALGAFGPWSLPASDTDEGRKLEACLDSAITYYQRQQEQRGWYGYFDYGDFRHSYDADRHTWKYDIGGWAWQQTELVPTYWLWLQFLRTGREDVFSLAESMSRNTSEVDCYHFGKLKGLGSRHNVRHWGCPCKEPRVSMAGHHRPMYYLTGDLRVGKCMQEMANAQSALANTRWYTKDEGRIRCRTAPDWSSLLSDWMTAYERTRDEAFRRLALNGIKGILAAPMGFGSGPIFAFVPETGEMIYEGEQNGNIHLTQCFATLQILLEASDAMDLPELRAMCADYGKIYLMSDQERAAAFGGCAQGKTYGMPYTASGMGAYSGYVFGDRELKRRAWRELLLASPLRYSQRGFEEETYAVRSDGKPLTEIPWMSTNYISQWCLNTIMVLAFAGDAMPGKAEMDRLASEKYHLAL